MFRSLTFGGPGGFHPRRGLSLRSPRASRTSVKARALFEGAGLELSRAGLGQLFLLDLAINWVGWGVSSLLKTEKYYDMLGSFSFVSTAAYSLATSSNPLAPRSVAATAMVACWAARLGSFLVRRVFSTGHDSRFDGVRDNPSRFFIYWTMQAVWVWVTSLPVYMLHAAGNSGPAGVTWTDIAGPLIWLAGLLIESVADTQKTKFRSDPRNKGKFIDQGLWSKARYPNYGGEILVWTGMCLFCTAGGGALLEGSRMWSLVSPLFVTFLLTKMSGVPIQEEQAKQRWGQDPTYQAYRKRTNLLFPLSFP
jgi:steroid 5-alpha reductase family enzyme